MPRGKHQLVQLETRDNNGGGWILTPKFEMMILETQRTLFEARRAQEELTRDNRKLTKRLRSRYHTEEVRLLLRFLACRQNRPDLSPREIGKRLGITQRKADNLSKRLRSILSVRTEVGK